MNQNELNRTLEIIRRIEHDGKNPPKSVIEIPELEKYYLGFEDIMERINDKVLELSIPNFKLFGVHDFIVPKAEKKISQIILFLPYLVAILISIYGISIGNYWFLTTFAVAFLAPILSSILTGIIPNLILVGLCGYFFYSDKLTLGFVCLTALISTICTSYLKRHRQNSLINIAKSNEEIFAFLFHNRTITIHDKGIDGMLYSK
ncbi:hypothetical protein [Winogradskyella wichelsiae]|uniref:hypothetical protein n=1 Tax=Winogradskyella wichelsiae TaxID=2697007 RepID=UPI003EF7AD08